jgi:3-oxoacyl-[acyl-carrier protein] reductase
MDLGLRGKVALVAASSQGIGKAIALGLAAEGVHVGLCARNADTLRQAAIEIKEQAGVEVYYKATDLTVAQQVEDLVMETQRALGPVDIVINNAGGPPSGNFAALNDAAFRAALELNLMTAITLTRLVLPKMKERNWGRVINITSIAAKEPIDSLILSTTARAGLIGWAKSLANEVAAYNVTVNNVCPGYTLTQRVEELAASLAAKEHVGTEAVIRRWQAAIPMGRLALPAEIADAVLYLASQRASYVTGVTLQVDGGYIQSLF